MAINKGLLLGASFANGLNAFLDAREKGDLQRQRQSLADFNKQMKIMQMDQSQQRLDLAGEQIELDREKLRSSPSKTTLNAADKALAELQSEANFRINQGLLDPTNLNAYLQEGMQRKGFAPLTEEEKKLKTKTYLDKVDPELTLTEARAFGVDPGTRRSQVAGMTPSRKKSSVSSDGKQITITDEYDPEYYEVVDISSGELDPEVAITLANQALDYGSKNLSSSNRKVKNFQDVSDSYLKLKVAVNAAQTEIARAKSEGRKANFIAIDNAITTVFIKMLDPGSVVREQEYARLLQDMGITERWIGRIGNAIRGGYLTESSRQAVLDMAQKMMVASELGYMKESIKHYGQIKSLGEAVGEGLGEKYAHLATGIEYVLSDGTTFDFKNSSFEDLNQLRKERTAMLMKGDFGDKNSAISSAVNDYENAAQKSGKVGDFWNLAKSSYDQANLFFNPIPSSNGSADTEPDLTSKVTTYDWEGGE